MTKPLTATEILYKVVAENWLEKAPHLKKLLETNPKTKQEYIKLINEVRNQP
jgi:hypothetical protein